LSMVNVKRLIIENVPEFVSWGPLGDDNRPILSEKGKLFQQWV
jgi:DNA (cytosine-5)-methyltransferase 1